jgi:2'-deoxynucleoside 5'-phosphate N-hydrolase
MKLQKLALRFISHGLIFVITVNVLYMKAYVAVSYGRRTELNEVTETMKRTLRRFNIEPLVFVDHYHFESHEEKAMMEQAFAEIDSCALLLAETTEKGIGIGVEAGYARGKNIPVIYLRNAAAPHSTTVAGASQHQVIYADSGDLENQLTEILYKLKFSR